MFAITKSTSDLCIFQQLPSLFCNWFSPFLTVICFDCMLLCVSSFLLCIAPVNTKFTWSHRFYYSKNDKKYFIFKYETMYVCMVILTPLKSAVISIFCSHSIYIFFSTKCISLIQLSKKLWTNLINLQHNRKQVWDSLLPVTHITFLSRERN